MSKSFEKDNFRERLSAALNSDNSDEFVKVISEFAEGVEAKIKADMALFNANNDAAILAKRGVVQLTKNEKEFYAAFKNALKSGDIKAAFTGVEHGFNETVLVRTLDDIRSEFPLLDKINLVDTSTVTKIIRNTQGLQLAAWGELGSTIENALDGSFDEIDVTHCKLLAIVPVSIDMLEAPVEWLDVYVRAILVEAIGSTLSAASTTGTGKKQPIGMIKDLAGQVVDGVYPDKTAVTIKYFNAEELGPIISTLATNAVNGRSRAINELICVVNPVTYFSKIIPAIRRYNYDGTYCDSVPFPIEFIQEPSVPNNKAILGIGAKYFLGVGYGGKSGNINYSDEVKFLDDLRVYKGKAYANGMPDDNNAFTVLDVTKLKKEPIKTLTVTETEES